VKSLFIAESVVVGIMGSALILFPAGAPSLTFGSSLEGPVGTVIARGIGALLIVLAWVWRNTSQSRPTNRLIGGMLLYDVGVGVVLLYSRFSDGLTGVLLWPTVALHLALGLWCLVCLIRDTRSQRLVRASE
jgi:hypothetical protein